MFEQRRYEFILECVQALAHASESIGNESLAMREKRRLPDGSFAHIPIITGDTMRHGLRDAIAHAFLDAAGLYDTPLLTEEALRLLFAGGMISGSDGKAVQLDTYRDMVRLCPQLALLGGCAQSRSIPGKVWVDAAELICTETAHRMPPWAAEWIKNTGAALAPSRAHIESVQRVRMDPALDPSKRALLAEADVHAIEKRLSDRELAGSENDAALAERSKSSMLPRRHETVVAGSWFYWSVTATIHSDLDRDTFDTMVGMFLLRARVGGKKATGHGRIRSVAAQAFALQRYEDAPIDATALAPQVGQLFFEHVRSNRENVGTFLRELDA